MNSHKVFIHIHQGCFAGTGAIVRLPQCQWSKPDGYGKISQCITTTKHSNAKTACIFLGIYCRLQPASCLVHLASYVTVYTCYLREWCGLMMISFTTQYGIVATELWTHARFNHILQKCEVILTAQFRVVLVFFIYLDFVLNRLIDALVIHVKNIMFFCLFYFVLFFRFCCCLFVCFSRGYCATTITDLQNDSFFCYFVWCGQLCPPKWTKKIKLCHRIACHNWINGTLQEFKHCCVSASRTIHGIMRLDMMSSMTSYFHKSKQQFFRRPGHSTLSAILWMCCLISLGEHKTHVIISRYLHMKCKSIRH